MSTHKPKPGNGRYSVLKVEGGGFIIRDPEGDLGSKVYAKRDWAEEVAHRLQLSRDAASRAGPRRCMCCGQEFESSGIGNRLCLRCRHGFGEADPQSYSFGSMTGRRRAS